MDRFDVMKIELEKGFQNDPFTEQLLLKKSLVYEVCYKRCFD